MNRWSVEGSTCASRPAATSAGCATRYQPGNRTAILTPGCAAIVHCACRGSGGVTLLVIRADFSERTVRTSAAGDGSTSFGVRNRSVECPTPRPSPPGDALLPATPGSATSTGSEAGLIGPCSVLLPLKSTSSVQ